MYVADAYFDRTSRWRNFTGYGVLYIDTSENCVCFAIGVFGGAKISVCIGVVLRLFSNFSGSPLGHHEGVRKEC